MLDSELSDIDFGPQRWLVEGILPLAGMSFIASKAKAGKSYVGLDLCGSIARGEPFLGRYPTTQGDVLHLVLEDPLNETQKRMHRIWKARDWQSCDTHWIESEWPTNEGGQAMREIADFVDDMPNTRLVYVDMMNQFEPLTGTYRRDLPLLMAISKFARNREINIMISLHTWGGKAITATNPYWEDKVQGGRAAAAVAQAMWGLAKEPHAAEGILHVKGKSFQEEAIPVVFDPKTLTFRTDDSGIEANALSSDERTELLQIATRLNGGTPTEISKLAGKTTGATRWLLKSMKDRGEVVLINGRYYSPAQAIALTAPPDPQTSFLSEPQDVLHIA